MGSTKPFTHSELCAIAAIWIKKPISEKGHGCQVAFTETKTGFLAGECPDAIGFRVSTRQYGAGSVVVECKTSRADFLQDRDKPHRAAGQGMGRFRYYMCPEGLISASELPASWGLVYVGVRKRITVIAGATLKIQDPGVFDCENDLFGETMLLANLMDRIGNAEQLNARLRAADRLNSQLNQIITRKEQELDALRRENFRLLHPDLVIKDQQYHSQYLTGGQQTTEATSA